MKHFYYAFWWVFLLRGISALIIGLLALFMPGITIATLSLFFGAYLLIDGFFTAIAALAGRKHLREWGWLLFTGIAGIGLGLFTLYNPFTTVVILLYLVAFWALVAGIMEIITAIRLRKHIEGEAWYIAEGILTLLFALIIFTNPITGALVLVWIFGLYALFASMLLIALSLRLRKRHKSHTID